MAEKKCKDLPDECWELIFNKLHQLHPSHLESSSLSCKRFLSLTNTLRTHFTITDITQNGHLSKHLNRFPNLNSISLRLSNGPDLDPIITHIATNPNSNLQTLDFSGNNRLPLNSLKTLGSSLMKNNLRALHCVGLVTLRDIDLFVIADSMPCLEELDISYPFNYFSFESLPVTNDPGEVAVTDKGIEALSSKLKGLRKINVSGNDFLTNNSLIALSANCVYLTDITVFSCSLITLNGIEFVMRNSADLTSLSVSKIDFSRLDEDTICRASNVSNLEIWNSVITDGSFRLLAKAGVPLKSLSLNQTRSTFTFSGISALLNKYRSLEYLHLMRIDFLTDEKMSELSQWLSALVTISLVLCPNLTESTVFKLAKNCPLLEVIRMEGTNVGGGGGGVDGATTDIANYSRIKFLNFASNPNLSDECLAKVASLCPSLEMLDVSFCKGITEKGIADFFKSGSKIRKLGINECVGIKSIGNDYELSELNFLEAARSGLKDDGLAVIGNKCRGLLHLNLGGCLGVTTVGLEEILTNCKILRHLDLTRCLNVSTQAVDWMVFSRPSLRKIIVSDSSLPSECQRKLFLSHGCLVFAGMERQSQL